MRPAVGPAPEPLATPARGHAPVSRPRWLDLPGRAVDGLERERACWAVLGAAMALWALLGLRLTRGTTFFTDEVTYFVANRGLDPQALLSPHKGHLILIPRLIYASVFALFGPDYFVFRIIQVLGIALVAGLFFVLAKRRIGAPAALAPSVLLLFFGAGWVTSLSPVGITHVYCLAAALAAFLALDRDSRRSDLAACGLLTVAVATFSVGLAVLVGVAVSVLLRGDRWQRAFIFVIPAALYLLWYLAAPKLTGPEFAALDSFQLSNALLIPNYAADAAAAVTAALAGLGSDFAHPGASVNSSWGFVVAAGVVAALVLRVRRGDVPVSLWRSLAYVLAFWASAALVTGPNSFLARLPDSNQYLYAGAVGVLLVVTDAARGIRLSQGGLLALFAVTALALLGNIAQMRTGGSTLRTYSKNLPTSLTALEIVRDHVAPGFMSPVFPSFGYSAGTVLAAADRSGSFGPSLPELRRESELRREAADATVAAALGIKLIPGVPPRSAQSCRRVGPTAGRPLDLLVRPPGALLFSDAPQILALRRFASIPIVAAGALAAHSFGVLRIPKDRAADPWHVAFSGAGPVTVCPL